MAKEIPIRKLAKTIGASMNQTVRAIKIELFNGVIRDTRVDTGRLRANWQATNASPAQSEVDRVNEGAAYDEVRRNVTADGVDYLTNNLPYAEVWEERDGMIARNAVRIDRIVREKIDDSR